VTPLIIISGTVTLFGTNTFEGGAVLKYTNGASLTLTVSTISSRANWLATAYRPVIFTAKDDDSVGETISGSTGTPTNYYAGIALQIVEFNTTLANLRIAYAQQAIWVVAAGSSSISDAQFINCQEGILATAGPTINLRNVLFANVATNFSATAGVTFNAQNVTFSGSTNLATGDTFDEGVTFLLTNCILANVASLTNGFLTLSGDHNGFYKSRTFGTGQVTNTFYPFQSVGGGSFYLTNGCSFVNAGTTNLDPTLLAELRQTTTFTPQAGNFPDTNAPDLGLHYPLTVSSTGTDFWLAFMDMLSSDNDEKLSLYISSPVGATGTVTILGLTGNGSLLTVTNCGDTNLNGTYMQTNLTTQEQEDWINNDLDPDGSSYVFGTNWVNISEGAAFLFRYDSNMGMCTSLYFKPETDLNGSDWQLINDTNPQTPITIWAPIALSEPFTVAAGAVTNVNIPADAMMGDRDNDVVETDGIHITASQPVSVYALDYNQFLSAAFTGYPTPLLGTNYCILAHEAVGFPAVHSELAIIATASNTKVTITPSATADLTGHSGMFTTNLDQGQAYQISSEGDGGGDVTGTFITSDKPIAVFAGADDTDVPDDFQADNPLVQEQLPVDQWGNEALALSLAGRTGGDTYRVLAAYDNTVVTITMTNGTIVVTNQAGQFYEKTNIDGPVEFQGSQPIQVAQFANGKRFDSPINNEGDPCEILLPPIGHYLQTNIVFTLPNDDITGDFNESFLNIITAQSAITNTFVDGSHIATTNFVAIGSSGYYGAQITMTNSGVHTVSSSQPIEVQVYGFGFADAYGYFGGVVK
jgi:hypothetical protein